MTLHLLRFDPDMARVARWLATESLTPRDNEDDGYGWHALLTAAFGRDLTPKLFRVFARRGRPTHLLAYAQADAPTLRARAIDFADPAVIEALGVHSMASKQMPDFTPGRRLGFSARLRPTVRTDRDGNRAKSRELDVFVAAKLAAVSGQELNKISIYAEWARNQIDAVAAEVESLRVDGMESSEIVRRGRSPANGSRSFARISGHTVTVVGTIRVADAASFATLLARGLGRHRTFGYGMVLLSPAER
jgi:CRISPR system Cascade subunit CasE